MIIAHPVPTNVFRCLRIVQHWQAPPADSHPLTT